MLHGFACDSAAEAELLSQQVCIPESAFWTGVITRSCPEVGHVSYAVFAEFKQLMQSVLSIHKGFDCFEAKSEFERV